MATLISIPCTVKAIVANTGALMDEVELEVIDEGGGAYDEMITVLIPVAGGAADLQLGQSLSLSLSDTVAVTGVLPAPIGATTYAGNVTGTIAAEYLAGNILNYSVKLYSRAFPANPSLPNVDTLIAGSPAAPIAGGGFTCSAATNPKTVGTAIVVKVFDGATQIGVEFVSA